MKEIWVKKTIQRRYLIADHDYDDVLNIVRNNADECIDEIEDLFDKSKEKEYDLESPVLPLEIVSRDLGTGEHDLITINVEISD